MNNRPSLCLILAQLVPTLELDKDCGGLPGFLGWTRLGCKSNTMCCSPERNITADVRRRPKTHILSTRTRGAQPFTKCSGCACNSPGRSTLGRLALHCNRTSSVASAPLVWSRGSPMLNATSLQIRVPCRRCRRPCSQSSLPIMRSILPSR